MKMRKKRLLMHARYDSTALVVFETYSLSRGFFKLFPNWGRPHESP